METLLEEKRMRTGATLRVLRVEPPDPRWDSAVRGLLAHKPRPYDRHIDYSLRGECGALETRFYLGVVDDEAVANVMTVERRGVGILGHVFTRPDHRREGIATTVMNRQMIDFKARGGKVLLLGTGYQSHAYRMYASFGFQDWAGGDPGLMRWDDPDDPDYSARFFTPGAATVEIAGWEHWPLVALLGATPVGIGLRSISLGLRDLGLMEGPYCAYMARMAGRDDVTGRVLVSHTGAVVGLATLIPDDRWRREVHLLDLSFHLLAHPDDLLQLARQMPLQGRRVQCVTDPADVVKIGVLDALGFVREAILPRQFKRDGVWRDAWLYGVG